MVDKSVLENILTNLEEYLGDLEEIKSEKKLEDYQKDKIIRRYTERTLQMSIEACLDIANHLISYSGFREPLDNKDCFQVLQDNGIIPEDVTENLKKMAQFRNVVVHDYLKVNPEIVYAILHKNLPDITAFAQIIEEKFLD